MEESGYTPNVQSTTSEPNNYGLSNNSSVALSTIELLKNESIIIDSIYYTIMDPCPSTK